MIFNSQFFPIGYLCSLFIGQWIRCLSTYVMADSDSTSIPLRHLQIVFQSLILFFILPKSLSFVDRSVYIINILLLLLFNSEYKVYMLCHQHVICGCYCLGLLYFLFILLESQLTLLSQRVGPRLSYACCMLYSFERSVSHF